MIALDGPSLTHAALGFLITLLGLTMLSFAVLLSVQIARGRARRRQAAAAAAVRPELQQALVRFLAGSPVDSTIRGHLASYRQEVIETLLSFQSTVGGGARDRLCGLALDLGLVHDWCQESPRGDLMRRRQAMARLAFVSYYEPCRRVSGEALSRALEDPDHEIRLSAARGLAQTGIQTDVEDVFLLALGPNRFIRAVLTEELRRHAMILCAGAVPEVLGSGQSEYVRATLEILTAWERAIPIEHLRRFLDHRDRETRILALKLAPLTTPDPDSRAAICRSLSDHDPEARYLAIAAAGRLKLAEALPQLAACMRQETIEGARLAAGALFHIPPEGRMVLRELAAGKDIAARAAREVLERAAGGA
jgi:HEAT repeat protein